MILNHLEPNPMLFLTLNPEPGSAESSDPEIFNEDLTTAGLVAG